MSLSATLDAPRLAVACGGAASAAVPTAGIADLLTACACGDAEAVGRLLKVVALGPGTCDRDIPVGIAASRGHAEAVKLLVAEARAVKSYNWEFGFPTVLAAAAARGDIAVVEAIVRCCEPGRHSHSQAVLEAASHGHLAVVELILAAAGAAHTEGILSNALFRAAEHRQRHIVEAVLLHPACRLREKHLRAAARAGDTHVLRLLLGDTRVAVLPSLGEPTLSLAAAAGHLDALQLLLEEPRCVSASSLRQALLAAAAVGYLPIVDLLLRFTGTPGLDAGAPAGGPGVACDGDAVADAMVRAAAFGHADLVGLFIADRRDRGELPGKTTRALVQAATHGHMEVIELLLADSQGDPSARDFSPVRAAARVGQTAALRRLLADPRVAARRGDASKAVLAALDEAAGSTGLMSCDSGCNSHDSAVLMRHAATAVAGRFGRPTVEHDMDVIREVVAQTLADATESLLSDAHSTGDSLQVMTIRAAASARTDLVARLLADPRLVVTVPPRHGRISSHTHAAETALQAAAEEGRGVVVSLLLAASPCWTREQCQEALVTAATLGHTEAVEALLADPRTDPTTGHYAAFKVAAEKDRAAVLEVLMQHDRVDRTAAGAQVLAGLGSELIAAQGDFKHVAGSKAAVCGSVGLLHACLAAAPSAGLPSFLRRDVRNALPSIAARGGSSAMQLRKATLTCCACCWAIHEWTKPLRAGTCSSLCWTPVSRKRPLTNGTLPVPC